MVTRHALKIPGSKYKKLPEHLERLRGVMKTDRGTGIQKQGKESNGELLQVQRHGRKSSVHFLGDGLQVDWTPSDSFKIRGKETEEWGGGGGGSRPDIVLNILCESRPSGMSFLASLPVFPAKPGFLLVRSLLCCGGPCCGSVMTGLSTSVSERFKGCLGFIDSKDQGLSDQRERGIADLGTVKRETVRCVGKFSKRGWGDMFVCNSNHQWNANGDVGKKGTPF